MYKYIWKNIVRSVLCVLCVLCVVVLFPVVEGPCKRYVMARHVCQATTASRGRRRSVAAACRTSDCSTANQHMRNLFAQNCASLRVQRALDASVMCYILCYWHSRSAQQSSISKCTESLWGSHPDSGPWVHWAIPECFLFRKSPHTVWNNFLESREFSGGLWLL